MWDFWEFIVSGRVPGSTIEVTFELWLKAMAIVLSTVVAIRLITALNRRRRTLKSIKSMLEPQSLTETTAS